MDRKKQLDVLESSDDEEETGSGSSDEDEFDSEDDRVNQIPSQTINSDMFTFNTEDGKSSEEEEEGDDDDDDDGQSESESESEETTNKPAAKRSQIQQSTATTKSQVEHSNGGTVKSQVEQSIGGADEVNSEAESESGSDETQEVNTNMGSVSQKPNAVLGIGDDKPQSSVQDEFYSKKGRVEDAHSVKKSTKAEALKQQNDKDKDSDRSIKKEGMSKIEQKDDQSDKKQKEVTSSKVEKEAKQGKDEEEVKSGKEDKDMKISKFELGKRIRDDELSDKEASRKKKKDPVDGERSSVQSGDKKSRNQDTKKDTAKKLARVESTATTGNGTVHEKKAPKPESEAKQDKKGTAKEPSSPQKQKKVPHVWSPDEEILLSQEVLNHVKLGMEIPSRRSDEFWVKLSETLQGKLDVEFSKEQLSEKLRRMKGRYQTMANKIKESQNTSKPYKHKNATEQTLYDIWNRIWGKPEIACIEERDEVDLEEEPTKTTVVEEKPALAKGNHDAKLKPCPKAKASDDSRVSDVDRGIVKETPMDLDKDTLIQCNGEQQQASLNLIQGTAPTDGGQSVLDIQKLVQTEIQTSLHEFQEWSKQSLENWTSKATMLIENSVKALANQPRQMNGMGHGFMLSGSFHFRNSDILDFQTLHGEQAFQQEWYELQLQELNIYSQRLKLMQKECELKQEQLKLQLQLERGQQG